MIDLIADGSILRQACNHISSGAAPAFFMPSTTSFKTRLNSILSAVIFLVVVLSNGILFAQMKTYGISGTALEDSTNKPLQYVNVAVMKSTDSGVVTGCSSNEKGYFQCKGIPAGEYYLALRLLGYKAYQTRPFVLDEKHAHLNTGELHLIPTEVRLDEVIVEGERSLYTASIDRKTYNVGKDIMSQAGSASDVLQNVPSVQVDIDGNVTLRGSSAMIMINGRTSPLMDRNSATVLQQMPASSIEKIEIITNPSAKFKPDGTAGIINIVLKKDVRLGMNGSVAVNAGSSDRYNGNVRLNYNDGGLNVYGSYSLRRDYRSRFNSDDRSQVDSAGSASFFDGDLTSTGRPLAHIGALGAEYQFTEADLYGVSGNIFSNSVVRYDIANNLYSDSTHTPFSRYQRFRRSDNPYSEYEYKTFYEHAFTGEEHKLRIELTGSFAPENESNLYHNVYSIPAGMDSYDNANIPETEHNTQVTVEYSRPVGEGGRIEAGYDGEFTSDEISNRVENLDETLQSFVVDTGKTNSFLFNESRNSVYATFRQTFGGMGVLAGLRGEHVSLKSDLLTLGTIVPNSYDGVYPSLHLAYTLSQFTELQLSYSKRTRRPDAGDLNPFAEYRDPHNISIGNPKLLPEFVHSVECGVHYFSDRFSLLPELFYRYTYNRMTTVTTVVSDTMLVSTRQNLSSDQAAGVELVASGDAGEYLTAHLNTSAYINTIDASNLGYSSNKSVFTLSSALTLDVKFGPATRIQISSNYNSARLTPQGEISPSYSCNLGFRRLFLDDKLTFVFTISDIFKTLKRETVLTSAALNETTVNRRDARVFYLGFNYRFGVQPRKAREEQMKYDDGL